MAAILSASVVGAAGLGVAFDCSASVLLADAAIKVAGKAAEDKLAVADTGTESCCILPGGCGCGFRAVGGT
jgi:hypothetical protein